MSHEIKKWTPNQLKAIYWFATPKVERKPRFQKEFAETLGLREKTISRWNNDPDLSAEVGRVARAELGKDLPEVYGTLRKMAINGSFQHMKFYLELLEEHRKEVDVNFTDKRRKLREELTELERKRRESAPHRELGCADEAS
jgi:Helix-turn-helix of insertion element transposase